MEEKKNKVGRQELPKPEKKVNLSLYGTAKNKEKLREKFIPLIAKEDEKLKKKK